MVASLWGMRSVDDLNFSLYFPYPLFPVTSSLSLHLSYSTRGSWSVFLLGIGHCLLFDTPSLSNGLLTQH